MQSSFLSKVDRWKECSLTMGDSGGILAKQVVREVRGTANPAQVPSGCTCWTGYVGSIEATQSVLANLRQTQLPDHCESLRWGVASFVHYLETCVLQVTADQKPQIHEAKKKSLCAGCRPTQCLSGLTEASLTSKAPARPTASGSPMAMGQKENPIGDHRWMGRFFLLPTVCF